MKNGATCAHDATVANGDAWTNKCVVREPYLIFYVNRRSLNRKVDFGVIMTPSTQVHTMSKRDVRADSDIREVVQYTVVSNPDVVLY